MFVLIRNGIKTLGLISREHSDSVNRQTYVLHFVMIWSVMSGFMIYFLCLFIFRLTHLTDERFTKDINHSSMVAMARMASCTGCIVGISILLFMFWGYAIQLDKDNESRLSRSNSQVTNRKTTSFMEREVPNINKPQGNKPVRHRTHARMQS